MTIRSDVTEIAEDFARERSERQLRRELIRADFDRLRAAGFLRMSIPVEFGGLWESVQASARPVCDVLRLLAHGDSSIALVSAMHPAILATTGWLTVQEVPAEFQATWDKQRREVFDTAHSGNWWGTIISEPGSGGDPNDTKAVAGPLDSEGSYALSGTKHFGSGSGITSYMITTAMPEGESAYDIFFFDTRGLPWDGSKGMTLLAPWDGHGMTATQSHSFQFDNVPVTRVACPRELTKAVEVSGAVVACWFTSVIVGIVEIALETAHRQLERRHATMRSYEQVEWTNAEVECWLINQAYEGMLKEMESDAGSRRSIAMGKPAIAQLAESALGRICRIIGGGSFSRSSPFGFWLEDVRALGFLRPPWGLAYDRLLEGAWPAQ